MAATTPDLLGGLLAPEGSSERGQVTEQEGQERDFRGLEVEVEGAFS